VISKRAILRFCIVETIDLSVQTVTYPLVKALQLVAAHFNHDVILVLGWISNKLEFDSSVLDERCLSCTRFG